MRRIGVDIMTARQMFENLGYSLKVDNNNLIEYSKEDFGHIAFCFDIETKRFYSWYSFSSSIQSTPHSITLDEFEAVQKQMEELGWIEEEERPETNYEHFKDEIIGFCLDDLAISKGKVVKCCSIPCSECDFNDKNSRCIGNNEIMKWLKQPYKKLPYKLSQWEYDLLNAYKNRGMRKCISNYGTLLEMYGKGHFKGIDTKIPIHEILDNCKVVL